MASMSASMVSMSRWFVGSSRTMRCGSHCVTMAMATRLFCPPLSVFTRRMAMSPWMPTRPNMLRTSWSVQFGNLACTHSTHVIVRSRLST
mmetsp:Transcript_20084/g.56942  ORF Transcript_20084/g.56942 Transcript_20084/m.56942 type:complete len:90 (-) Transcript_20084:215-484(-)